MAWKSMVLGVGVGFAAGWLVFAVPDEASAPSLSAPLEVEEPTQPPAVRAADHPPEPALATTSADTMPVDPAPREPILVGPQPVPPGVAARIAQLQSTLAAAREGGDWKVFRRTLMRLSGLPSAVTRSIFEGLLHDETLPLSGSVGETFKRGLRGSRQRSIAAGARRRFEEQIAAGNTSWVAAHGWFDLVAEHGDAADIAWLAERQESIQITDAARTALARSSNGHARRVTLERLRDPRPSSEYDRLLEAFLRHHPDEGFDLARELLEGDASSRSVNRSKIIVAMARAVPVARAPEAKDALRALQATGDRLAAVIAVQALHDRGVDVKDMSELLALPRQTLEEIASGEDEAAGAWVRDATVALQRSRLAWSMDAARGLEAAAERLAGPLPKGDVELMAEVAAQIRAGLASPWK